MAKSVKNTLERKIIENEKLISTIPSEYLDDLEMGLMQDMAAGKSLAEITDTIEKVFDVAKSSATRLARSETAKINSALTEARSEQLGISAYLFLSALRDNTRESHADMNEMVVDYDNPPELEDPEGAAHAGEPPNCYCWQNPIVLKESEDPSAEVGDEEGVDDRDENGGIDPDTEAQLTEETD